MTVLSNGEGRFGIEISRKVLLAGGSALDAVEQGIRLVEENPASRSVGRGGAPNILGEVQCDAAIMEGTSQMVGAVGALKDFLYPISVARAIMERMPHVMLVGDGAYRFAQEIGAEKAELLTAEAKRDYEKWLRDHLPPDVLADWPPAQLIPHVWTSAKDFAAAGGTTVFLAQDSQGSIAAGTSTAGWARGYPGRLGDSPVVSAGLYADTRYGAAGCTHTGEMTIRAATSRSVILYMKHGASVHDACREAVNDLNHLKGGIISGVIIHAIDHKGNPCVVSTRKLDREGLAYYFWQDGMAQAECREAEVVST